MVMTVGTAARALASGLILGALASAALAQAPAPAQSTVVRRSPFIPDCGPRPNPKIPDVFCRAPLAFLYDEAEQRLGSADLVYWTDGPLLNIAARSPTAHAELEGTIQEGLQPMSTIGSLWGATYQVPRLSQSLFELRLAGQAGETLVYRGPQAPPAPPSDAVLKGRMEVVEIKSAALQATRKVTIYVPPGAAPKAGWPALITVGGAEIGPYLGIIDALIEQRRIQPLAVVAVWDRAGDMDGREYLHGKDPDAYGRHAMFVDREVMPIAAGRFGVTKDPARRLLFGVGDGGDWAVQTAVRNPGMARAAAAFSVPGAAEAPFRQGKRLHLYMAAGAYEGPYLRGSRQTCGLASASGTPCVLDVAYAGHAPLFWQAELAKVLRLTFPAR